MNPFFRSLLIIGAVAGIGSGFAYAMAWFERKREARENEELRKSVNR